MIGGYTPAGRNFDAIIFGSYDDAGRLVYAARTRNGFTPASRDELFKRFRGLETERCPCVNLPEREERALGRRLDCGVARLVGLAIGSFFRAAAVPLGSSDFQPF